MKTKFISLLFLLFFIPVYPQLALETFESTSGPDPLPSTNWTLSSGNWTVFDNGIGLAQRWGINSLVFCNDSQTAYINRENIGATNTSEDYLVTPEFNVPTNGVLNFTNRTFTAGNQGTIYRVMIAPSSANRLDPFSYSMLAQYTENEISATFNVCEQKSISLSAFVGLNVYVAFVRIYTQPDAGINGDRWLLDNVSVATAPPCPLPNLTASNITSTSAILSWDNPGGATSWEIEVVAESDTPTGTGEPWGSTTKFVNATTLGVPFQGFETYKYYVKANCPFNSSSWSGPYSFTMAFSNIYRDNGTLTATRSLSMDSKSLAFVDATTAKGVKWNPILNDSSFFTNYSSDYITPNIDGLGMMQLLTEGGENSFKVYKKLTFGISTGATWMQSHFYNRVDPNTNFPLLINPLGGNVGINLGATTAPMAQLHTNGSLKFDGLNTTDVPNILTIGDDNLVHKKVATNVLSLSGNTLTSIVNGVSSAAITLPTGGTTTNAWDLNGNSITNGNFLGTTNNENLVFKRANAKAGALEEYNTSFGLFSLLQNIGYYNTAIGGRALETKIAGDNNTAIGSHAGNTLSSGSNNIFIGYGAQAGTTGNDQLSIGNWIYGKSGNIGIGVFPPQAKFHTNGTLKFDGLDTTTVPNVLTIGNDGFVHKKDLNSLLSNVTSTNIYNTDGTLTKERFVILGKEAPYNLHFLDDIYRNEMILRPLEFVDVKDSFLTIKSHANNFSQEPNLIGWGMSNIQQVPSGITLTQGLFGKATWMQSSNSGKREGRPEAFPLLINPLQGNVGIGVIEPTAQLHTINSVRFQDLANGERLDFVLGTDANGNVYEYDPAMLGGGSDTDDWKLYGNNNTNSNFNFIGTTATGPFQDFAVRAGNVERFRFTNSASGRIVVNSQYAANYDKNFYIGGGNDIVNPTTTQFGLIAANTAVGYGTLILNAAGNSNTALGSNALGNNTNGTSNVGLGVNALLSNKIGSQNVAVGVNALSLAGNNQAQNNDGNTAVGNQSLEKLTFGRYNIAIGNWSGFNLANGNGNILIGGEAPSYINNTSVTTAQNELNIGGWMTGSAGNLGIGVSPALPTAKLHTKGSLRFESLTASTENRILVINSAGNVSTRVFNNWTTTNSLTLSGNILTSTVNGVTSNQINLSSIITPSLNIYNSDGTLVANRVVAMNSNPLRFNFGVSPSSPSTSEVTINPAVNSSSSNLSVTVNRNDIPNLNGAGHSRVERLNGAVPNSFFTTGFNQGYFWSQASNPVANVQTASNYMINPIGGKVGIGIDNNNMNNCPDCAGDNYRLFVKKGIRTERIRVDLISAKLWADYVFDKEYKLMPLKELEKFITANKHLPNVPKAEEVIKTGIDLGEMDAKLLEKIEELTLHTIDINNKNEALEKDNKEQKAIIQSLIERLEKLEKNAKQ